VSRQRIYDSNILPVRESGSLRESTLWLALEDNSLVSPNLLNPLLTFISL
jgi:hypothetical protein